MAPQKKSDAVSQSDIIANLEKLKNGEHQAIKFDLTKIKIKTLAKSVGVVSEDVKLYMKLLSSKRYYALNDRTINLLLKGEIDMSATHSEEEQRKPSASDEEIIDILDKETEVEVFRVEKIKREQVVLSSRS